MLHSNPDHFVQPLGQLVPNSMYLSYLFVARASMKCVRWNTLRESNDSQLSHIDVDIIRRNRLGILKEWVNLDIKVFISSVLS